jgi:hypothetical protein
MCGVIVVMKEKPTINENNITVMTICIEDNVKKQ